MGGTDVKKKSREDASKAIKALRTFGNRCAELSEVLKGFGIELGIVGSTWNLTIPPAMPQNVIDAVCKVIDEAKSRGFTVFTRTKPPAAGFIYGTCALCEQGDKEVLPLDIDARFGVKRLCVCQPCIVASALASMTKKTTRVKKLPSGWKQRVDVFKIGSQNVGVAMTYQEPKKGSKK